MSMRSDDEEEGPSVDSNNQNERIEARRLRIQKRLEQLRRTQLGIDDDLELKRLANSHSEPSVSRAQIEDSRLRLTALVYDGYELVTNIQDATDAREGDWRTKEDETKRKRKERMESEAKAGTDKFDEITKKWESALQKEIPQDLYEMLIQQKSACDATIDEKNKLITDFQVELKQKDEHYVKDLKRQAEDVDLIIDRMEEHFLQQNKAYRDELQEIEKAFIQERSDLMENNHKKWSAMIKQRLDKECDYHVSRQDRIDDYSKRLSSLRIQNAEEYNIVKIKMETDVQILQQQLQQMKATYQLNQEKLEYNFQVLRKRDEENTITKSQQKRKITRLQDVLTNLRAKLSKQEKSYRDENQQLSDDYKRITEQFKEIQSKSMHFMLTDQLKFRDVWMMNEEKCKDIVITLLNEERIITEQQLGLFWENMDIPFINNIGPITNDKSEVKTGTTATQFATELLSIPSHTEDDEKKSNKGEDVTTIKKTKLPSILVKKILELIGDESGFLIEAKLKKLLTPLHKNERCLMRLDSIFRALGIESEDDVYLMANYFIRQIPNKEDLISTEEGHVLRASSSVVKKEKSISTTSSVSGSLDPEKEAEETLDEIMEGDEEITFSDIVHPNEVFKGLRFFVEENREAPTASNKTNEFSLAELEFRDNSKDHIYWKQYSTVVDTKTNKIWEALSIGLEKYNDVICSRAQLISETDSLKQQNNELRMLLHQYVNSKVNQELEIPPTKVLQLEMNT